MNPLHALISGLRAAPFVNSCMRNSISELFILPRNLAETESGSDPALDTVVHLPASRGAPNKACILNDALRHIFPSHAVIPPTAVVAVLQDDQASLVIRVDIPNTCVLFQSCMLVAKSKAIIPAYLSDVLVCIGTRSVLPQGASAPSWSRWCAHGAFTRWLREYRQCI